MHPRGGRGHYAPRGRSPRPAGGRSTHYHAPVGPDGHPVDDSYGSNDRMFQGGRANPQQRSRGGASKHFEPRPSSGYAYRQKQPAFSGNAGISNAVGPDGHAVDSYSGSNVGNGTSQGGRTNTLQRPQGGVSNHFEQKPSSGNIYRQKEPAIRCNAGFSNVVRHQQGQGVTNPAGSVSKPTESASSVSNRADDLSASSSQPVSKDVHMGARRIKNGDETGDNVALHHDFADKVKVTPQQDMTRLHSRSGAEVRDSMNKGVEKVEDNGDSGQTEHVEEVKRFDLCPSKGGSSIKLKPSLLEKNREKRNEIKRSLEGQSGSILRPGMVLLKNFLSFNDQVKIVKQCRDLGIGSGGFYQPGYGDGRELHLKMMCLGKNWDPETSKYGDSRPHDRATPPKIPNMFSQLVRKAIEDSHALIRTNSKATNAENVLPSMSPNICIVNFYTATGRLGLHQDKDETPESLRKGLPVVSFSLGDSAEFLYGDERDVDRAEKVVLESGDLLIFGGKSRHVFHGVTSILSNTAPKSLLEDTNLRPGRLNLTFREY